MINEEDGKISTEHVGEPPLKNLSKTGKLLKQTHKRLDEIASSPSYTIASFFAQPSLSFLIQRMAKSPTFRRIARQKTVQRLPRFVAGGVTIFSASHSFSLAQKETDKSKKQYYRIDGIRSLFSIPFSYTANIVRIPQEMLYAYNSVRNKKNNLSQDRAENTQKDKDEGFQHLVRFISGVSGSLSVDLMAPSEKDVINNILKKYKNNLTSKTAIKALRNKALQNKAYGVAMGATVVDVLMNAGVHKGIANYLSDYRDYDSSKTSEL